MKTLSISIIICLSILLASCTNINDCPSGPYKVHNWELYSLSSNYCIEKCTYCQRHRRVLYDEDYYEYEDVKTGSLSIRIPKSEVDK